MFDNIHIVDTLRTAGFVAGSIEVTAEPGVRSIAINDAACKNTKDVATEAARVMADAGYDILSYGRGLGGFGTLAILMVALPQTIKRAA